MHQNVPCPTEKVKKNFWGGVLLVPLVS